MDRNTEIRTIAYQLWESEGHPADRSVDHWLQAEMIWEQRSRGAAQTATAEEPEKKPTRTRRATPTKSGVSATKARRVRKS